MKCYVLRMLYAYTINVKYRQIYFQYLMGEEVQTCRYKATVETDCGSNENENKIYYS